MPGDATERAMSDDLNNIGALVAEIEADRAIGTPDHGGWGWYGGRNDLMLATHRGGRQYVMTFIRKGMNSAEPCFHIGGIMRGAISDLAMYEVGDGTARGQAQADKDPSVYRMNISGVDHPDARRMTRIPEMERTIIAAAARIEALERELAEAKTLIARNMFFDFGSAEDGCDFVGGMDGAVSLIEAYRAQKANGCAKHGPDFPPRDCTAWEDCYHDGVCHDPECSARKETT